MRKQIFAALTVLMLLMTCGCSDTTVVPEKSSEVVSKTESSAESKIESSVLSSESKETATPSSSPTATPKAETSKPPKDESKPAETTPAVTAPKENQTTAMAKREESVKAPAMVEPPKETPKPATPTPKPTPEPVLEVVQPKSAYDAPFDIGTIQSDCIGIGYGMGLSYDGSLTPSNSTWWNPVTASSSNQGSALRQNLENYIYFHTTSNLGSYGIDSITSFNIYYESRGNGTYSIYFLFA